MPVVSNYGHFFYPASVEVLLLNKLYGLLT
jgi:hypothetical protein